MGIQPLASCCNEGCLPQPILGILTPEAHHCELHRDLGQQGHHHFSVPVLTGLHRTGVQQRPLVDRTQMIIQGTGLNF